MVSPYFVARFVVEGGAVIRAAPILRLSLGTSEDAAAKNLRRRGFAVDDVALLR